MLQGSDQDDSIAVQPGTLLAVPRGQPRLLRVQDGNSVEVYLEVLVPSETTSEARGETCWAPLRNLEGRLTAHTQTSLIPLRVIRQAEPDSLGGPCTLAEGDVVYFGYIISDPPDSPSPLVLTDGTSFIEYISDLISANGDPKDSPSCASLRGSAARLRLADFVESGWVSQIPFAQY